MVSSFKINFLIYQKNVSAKEINEDDYIVRKFSKNMVTMDLFDNQIIYIIVILKK